MTIKTIPAQKRVQTFRSIQDMKTLFAYLNCAPISLEFCKETLKIENPIPIILALNVFGVKAKLDLNTSNIYIDQDRDVKGASALEDSSSSTFEEPTLQLGSTLYPAVV